MNDSLYEFKNLHHFKDSLTFGVKAVLDSIEPSKSLSVHNVPKDWFKYKTLHHYPDSPYVNFF